MKKKLVLIDGFSIIHRAFYGIPDLTNSKGLHTNAVYGFLNILFKVLAEEKAEYLTVAFDVSHPTFRHKMYEGYKGTRKPMPEELREQIPLLKEILSAMKIKMVEKAGYEADDILGTLAKKAEQEGMLVSVVSGDRDLLQLASDTVKIRIPKTKKNGTEVEDYNRNDVLEKYGIEPGRIVDLKGLMGDASDNIPGVPGIGEKTALKILLEFDSLENAYAHIDEVKPNRARENFRENIEQARLSFILAAIKTDCELDYQIEDGRMGEIFTKEAYQKLKELEFKSFLTRFTFEEESEKNHLEEHFNWLSESKEYKDALGKIKACCVEAEEGEKVILSVRFYGKNRQERLHPESEDGQYSIPGILKDGEGNGDYLGISFAYACWKIKEEPVYQEAFALTLKNAEERTVFCEGFRILLSEKPDLLLVTSDLKEQVFYWKEFLGEGALGERLKKVIDVSIAAYLSNPLSGEYGVDALASCYLGIQVPSYKERFAKARISKVVCEKDGFYPFACQEAGVIAMLWPVLLGELKKYQMEALFFEIEMPLVFTLYDMEERGIRVNKEALKEYGESLSGRILSLEEEIYSDTGEKFNINSPKQLGVILFEKLGLPFGKKTKTGYSTSADILEKLRSEHTCIDKILEYRQLTKLKSTYADGLSVFIEEDARIHGKLNQTITATGRLSSTEPNLQNIPIRMELGREIRKVFIPREGFLFLDADYSQIELRVLAHMSGDERLIEAYQKDADIHRVTASEVFHIPFDEVTEAQRRNAKAVNFGIVYGISSFGLGQDLNISRKEAEDYITKYFETYPKVKQYLDGLVEKGKKDGYVESYFHRIRPIPEFKSGNFMQRNFGERVAMNSPIQGTAADIMKIAMNRVNDRIKKEGLSSVLLLQIHDELLVETKEEEKEAVSRILKEEMESVVTFSVPLVAEVAEGKNWMEAH